MENSSKSKHRRPIFEKQNKKIKQSQSPMYQTAPAFHKCRESAPELAGNLRSQIIYTPKPQQIIRPHSVNKTAAPINIRVCSPFPISNPQPFHQVVIQRSSTPVTRAPVQYQQPINSRIIQRISSPICQPSQVVSRNICHSVNNSENINSSFVRRSQIKPTLVAVERIMKPIGENQVSRQVTVLKPDFRPISFSPKVREPQEVRVFQSVHRRAADSQKMEKLAQMNDILVQNYDYLYDQLQSLKGEANVQDKEIVQEDLFLKKTFCQIESIFNFYTHDTLSKISQIQRAGRSKKLQKSSKSQINFYPKMR